MIGSPQISDDLRKAIEVAKQRVQVDPYYPAAMNKGLKGHAKGYWAGTIMGLTTGFLVGGLLTLAFPATGFLTMIGTAGAAGAGLGGIIGSRVGISAGTVAGVMGEKERREKGKELEAEILASPEKQREVLQEYYKNPVVQKDDTVEELFATHDRKSAWDKMVNKKALALTVIIGASIGALIFGLPFDPAGSSWITNGLHVTSKWGAAAAGAIIGGSSGITFGVYFPGILATLSEKTGDILSGKMFNDLTVARASAPEVVPFKPLVSSLQRPFSYPGQSYQGQAAIAQQVQGPTAQVQGAIQNSQEKLAIAASLNSSR